MAKRLAKLEMKRAWSNEGHIESTTFIFSVFPIHFLCVSHFLLRARHLNTHQVHSERTNERAKM